MDTQSIINQNIDIYLDADSNDYYNLHECYALEFLDKVEKFEGWGRCRKLIDTQSPEYTTALDTLINNDFGNIPAGRLLQDAQSSSLTSFYTPSDVAHAITHYALETYHTLNYRDAHWILDPSAGTGVFTSALRGEEHIAKHATLSLIEKDSMTRKVLEAFYAALSRVLGPSPCSLDFDWKDFTELNSCYSTGGDHPDIIVSNIPFGDIPVNDRAFCSLGDIYKQSTKRIHLYYFLKSMRILSVGGILAFITTRGFLSSSKNITFRSEMLRYGRILNIVRLPDNLFKTVDVGSDLIIFQKDTATPRELRDLDTKPRLNRIFHLGWYEDEEDLQVSEEPGMSVPNCSASIRKNQYGKQVQHYKYTGTNLAQDLLLALRSHPMLDESSPQPTNPSTPKQSMTLKLPTSALPKQTLPLPSAVHGTTVPSDSVAGPTSTTVPDSSAVGPTSAGPTPSLFSLYLGCHSNTLLPFLTSILRSMYDRIDDDTRPLFLSAYTSLREVMTYNITPSATSSLSLHGLVKEFPTLPTNDQNFLLSLEKKDEKGNWQPADIFFHDIKGGLSCDMDAHQALAASLNEKGRVDMQFMQDASKLNRQELVENLKDAIFFNPINGTYEEADLFLTGNVVSKAKEARKHLEDYRNGERLEAEHAIAALEAARPQKIDFSDINVAFGARWIPTKYYEDFCYWSEGIKRGASRYTEFEIEYSEATDDYLCNLFGMHNHHEWKMAGYSEGDAIQWALRGAVPSFQSKDSEGKTHSDEERRREALKIVDRIKAAWFDFVNLPQNKHIREDIEHRYNDTFNCEVRPTYNGDFQTFPGLRLDNLGITALYPSQKNAIWMIKRNNGGICWHEVGTGKTLIMCVSTHEMKRIGLVNKPLIICMKANVSQVAETYRKAYPDAKVLFPSNADFSAAKRRELFDQIKNNDWDCIIMSHDQFCKIPAPEATELQVMQERIDKLDEVLGNASKRFNGRALSGLQKRRDNLRFKLSERRQEIATRKDKSLDFRDLGIDFISVDESQQFKNLGFETRHDRVAGIGNTEGSKRADMLLYAIRDIQYRKKRDLCATFLSGTIVSNSLTELYNIFTYLRPRALKAQNITSFDSWAAVFCKKKTDYEVNVVGQIVSKERFSQYVNLPELSKFLSQITDYRTAGMCGIDRPEPNIQFVSAPPTPQQETMLTRMVHFVNTGDWSELGIQRQAPANIDKALMLCATNIARQTALDPRMLDNCQTFGDEEGCKVRRCAENIARLYKETQADLGTQFVFNDISTLDATKWNMQQELHDVLVADYGIPSSEIAFINDATTDNKRLALFEQMNQGTVRVLIGSTTKLGTGVNAQRRAVAIHHLDIPWRPSDMEQRNGRACRQGNEVAKKRGNKVDIFIYATERTLDAYKFQLLKSKSAFICQLNDGTLGVRVIDEDMIGGDDNTSVSYAEFLSIVSGNTDLLDKARLDAKILALEKERAEFFRKRNQASNDIEAHNKEIATLTEWIKYAKIDLKTHSDLASEPAPVMTVFGHEKDCTDHKSAGKALYDIIKSNRAESFRDFGKCGSATLSVCCCNDTNYFYLVGTTGQYYKAVVGTNRTGIVGQVGHEAVAHYPHDTYNTIAEDIEKKSERIQTLTDLIPSLETFSKREWDGADTLSDLYSQLEEVKSRLTDTPPTAVA